MGLLIVLLLALVAAVILPTIIMVALEVLPTVVGVLVCLWLLHAAGCL